MEGGSGGVVIMVGGRVGERVSAWKEWIGQRIGVEGISRITGREFVWRMEGGM